MTAYDLVLIQSEEWAALYINGQLEVVGDSYLADERIHELYGVEVIGYDEGGKDVMPKGCKREDVPHTIESARAKMAMRVEERARAGRLREQAAQLMIEADRLEKGG